MKLAPYIILPLALTLARCGSPVAPADVSKPISDAVACGLGIIATAEGSINIQGLLACGLTVADALTLVQKLRAQQVQGDASAAVLSPARVAYVKKLDDAIVKLQAMQRSK
jgi:hypothetical protein